MGLKRDEKIVKPVDNWGAGEWEVAYHAIAAKYERLRDAMRRALNSLSSAI